MSAIRRYVYKAGSAVLGGQDLINLDPYKLMFQATVIVDIVSGSASWGLQFTGDEIYSIDLTPSNVANIRWLTDASFPANQTTSGIFRLDTAVSAIRLNLTALTGELRLTVIQGNDP